jgi:hypothetical protein
LSGEDDITSGEELYIPYYIVGIGIECCIYSSIGIESCCSVAGSTCDIGESSSDEDLVVWLESDGVDIVVGVGIEGEIKCSICVESRDTVAGNSSDSSKGSSDEDLAICLDRDGSDLISSCDGDVGIPGSIECSICVESRDIVASCSTDEGKSSSDKDLAICLDCGRIDDIVGIGIGESRIY